MKWTMKNYTSREIREVKEYAEVLDISEVMAKVLMNRGIDKKTAYSILHEPASLLIDPKRLINVEKAADEIIEAIENDAEIWIFADYDFDGLNSGYIITDFLRKTTSNEVHVYFPDRVDGYGLNMNFCKTLVERRAEENIKEMLVITVDNGTSCVEEVRYLKENGIKIVVTDHHKGKEILPDCTIVNAHIDSDPVFHHLSGCATAHKTVEVIQAKVKMNEDFASEYFFASAMGTIGDVMPMTTENIAIVRLGLAQLNGKSCPNAWKTYKSYLGKKDINAVDVAWELAPRLNATGRMGTIDTGANLFFSNEESNEVLKDLILEIEEINESRKVLSKKAGKEALDIDFSEDYVCIFDASKYPAGILGIIAGKIAEATGKMAMVMSGEDILTGSSRAPNGIDLQFLFKKELEKGNLVGYGGHAMAAGFSLKREMIDPLRASLNETIGKLIEEANGGVEVESELFIDDVVTLAYLNKKNYEELNSLPYDRGSLPVPLFMLRNLRVVEWKRSGNNPDNIKFTVEDETGKMAQIWAWKFGKLYEELGRPGRIDMAGKITQDFMSKRNYTMNVEGIQPSA